MEKHFKKLNFNLIHSFNNCLPEKKNKFVENDNLHNLRLKIIQNIEKELFFINLHPEIEVVLGGSIGIAIYPTEWSKKFFLTLLDNNYNIHYFGDKICPYGNDYYIATHKRISKYHSVKNVNHTFEILQNYY